MLPIAIKSRKEPLQIRLWRVAKMGQVIANSFLMIKLAGSDEQIALGYSTRYGLIPYPNDWSDYQDDFSKSHPELSTHKIVLLLDIVESYILSNAPEKLECYRLLMKAPLNGLSFEIYLQRFNEIDNMLNLGINVDKMLFKLRKKLLEEKNESLF